MYNNYLTYYAHQLYKQGYLRVNDQKNKDKISKIVKLANTYRMKKKLPSKLCADNVGPRPEHRMSIQELMTTLDACIKNKVVSDECATDDSIHEADSQWLQENARKKMKSKHSLVRAFINIAKQTRKVNTLKSATFTRRTTPMFLSPTLQSTETESPEK